MSKMFSKIKFYFDRNLWTKEMVANAVKKGKITEAEYSEITGESFLNKSSNIS